jgi:hypothetical protein
MRIFAFPLGLIAAAPFFAIACGGKSALDPGAGRATEGPLPTLSSAWPSCSTDPVPPSSPDGVDSATLALCTRDCNRTFDCEKCTERTCLPTCLDLATDRECGSAMEVWLTCVLAHDGCSAPPECFAPYCAYTRCRGAPTVGCM